MGAELAYINYDNITENYDMKFLMKFYNYSKK